jgi:hypothetical protein
MLLFNSDLTKFAIRNKFRVCILFVNWSISLYKILLFDLVSFCASGQVVKQPQEAYIARAIYTDIMPDIDHYLGWPMLDAHYGSAADRNQPSD